MGKVKLMKKHRLVLGIVMTCRGARRLLRNLRGNVYTDEVKKATSAMAWAKERKAGDTDVRLLFSNVTSVASKVGRIIENAQGGLHAIVETAADESAADDTSGNEGNRQQRKRKEIKVFMGRAAR